MSKEFKHIDDLFKTELGPVKTKAPAHIKGNIDKAIGFKKKRGFLFFLIPVLVLGISIPIVYYSMNNNKLDAGTTSEQHLNPTNSSGSEGVNVNNNPTNDLTLTKNTSIQQNEKINNVQESNNTENNEFNTTNYNSSSELSTDLNTTERSTNVKSNLKKDDTSNLQDKNTKNDDSQQTEKGSDNSIVSNDISTDDSENETEDTSTEIVEEELDNEDSTIHEEIETTQVNDDVDSSGTSDIETNDSIDNSDIDSTDFVEEIDSSADETIEDLVEEVDSTKVDEEEPEHDIEPLEPKYKPWMVGINGGLQLKNSKLTAVGDTTDQFYSQSVQDKVGYGIGIDVNYRLKNSLMFGAGISYASYSEKYDYQKSETTVTDTTYSWNVVVVDSIVDSVGTTYIYDSTLVEDYTYANQELFNQQGTNKMSYLHIPFRFGAEFIANKWRFDVYVQGRYNLALASNVSYLSGNSVVTQSFKHSYFDMELGGAVHYNIWNNLYLTGVVRYRPPLRNPYYSPALLNKMQYVYLGGGITFNF